MCTLVFQEVKNNFSLFGYKFKYFELNFDICNTSRKMKSLRPKHMNILLAFSISYRVYLNTFLLQIYFLI